MDTSDFLESQTPKQLLQLTGAIIDELMRRGINRTGNNPLSDYTEWLVAKSLGLTLAPTSAQGFDATDDAGDTYEIKGRRLSVRNRSRQLSAIRDIAGEHFQFLVAVVFEPNLDVRCAFVLPRQAVLAKGRRNEHTNSLKLHATDNLRDVLGVKDVTEAVRVNHPNG